MNSGVYVITNARTGRIYIGQTRNFARRESLHWSSLRKGAHHNTRLQADWDQFGEAAFKFRVHEVANRSEAIRMEKELIAAHMGSGCYNWSPDGSCGRPKLPEDKRLIQRSIRLRPDAWAALESLGMDWLRAEIDAMPG